MQDPSKIKSLKNKIAEKEARIKKMIGETTKLWDETGLAPDDPSYLIEKTMRFEVAQKSVADIFSSFMTLAEDYKSLCEELEKNEE